MHFLAFVQNFLPSKKCEKRQQKRVMHMINFTVGPVQMDDEIAQLGGQQIPYFRTEDFSNLMKENEDLILQFSKAPKNSRAIFITGSGTASMESVVINLLSCQDRVLLIDGGAFGKRFANMLDLYGVPYEIVRPQNGQGIKKYDLEKIDGKKFCAVIVNVHETSTGILYDLDLIGDFCKKNSLLFIVDAISSFLADEIDMQKQAIDVLISDSQKALACPPGVSIIVLSQKAVEIVEKNKPKCFYLNLQSALKKGEVGQTPYTPAVSILIQINARLKQIKQNGGESFEIEKTRRLAKYFRDKIQHLPLEITSKSMSNAATPLHPKNVSAHDVFLTLLNDYGICVCPNGGELRDEIFRVGHIGNLNEQHYDVLINAFEDMVRRGKL